DQRPLTGKAAAHLLELLRRIAFARVDNRHALPQVADADADDANGNERKQDDDADDDRNPRAFLFRRFVSHNVSSVPAPVSAARRSTRSAATMSSTAMPSDLKTVMSDSDVRP